jgi:prepilin-type processing-associated H-X9-DG protein
MASAGSNIRILLFEPPFAVANRCSIMASSKPGQWRTRAESKMTDEEMTGGLPLDADLMLPMPPEPPFDWVREGTSLWLFEENGEFGIPRIGVEAEPHSWHQRRFAANFAFADGRVLQDMGVGLMPPVLDEQGRPAVLGGGPITLRCIEPFRRWHVKFDGEVVDTTVADQIASSVDRSRRTPLRYEVELTMAVPANVQDNSPQNFFTWGKGKQRDAVSVGLGWRFEQMLRGEGELEVDGTRRGFRASGSRVKRRSVRTEGLMLRGHCWQAAVFPDGRAFGFEARPVHDDGFEPWNEGFVFVDGRMHRARAINPRWLGDIVPRGEDVSVELHSDLGVTRIRGTTELSTFRIAGNEMWGLNLHQGGVRYLWDGQEAYGMIERSMPTARSATLDRRG